MKCPECQTENLDGNRFCRKCGGKLAKMCPQCEAEVFADDSFCGTCGQNLILPSGALPKDLSFDEKIDKIQRYLPKGFTEKILSQRDKYSFFISSTFLNFRSAIYSFSQS